MAVNKILLVEDDAIEAMDIKKALESFGYDVPYTASRGDEAVEKASDIQPDLVVMDITLKGEMNGITAASKIKELNIPVIYLTAHSDEYTLQKAKLTGPYGYILKPYDPLELKYAIEIALFKKAEENINILNRELEDQVSMRTNELNKTIKKLNLEIKERKKAEEKFQLLFERAPVPYQSLDKNGNFLEVNPAWLNCLGYAREDVIGHNFSEFLAPGYDKHFKKNFPKFKEAGEIHCVEFKMKHKTGAVIHVSFEGRIGYDDLGHFQQTHCVFQDITDRKMVEEELKLASLYNRSLIEASLDPLVTIGPDGKITDVNKATEDVTGYKRDKLIGTDFSNYFTDPDRARAGYLKVFDNGFVRDYSLEIEHCDGGVTPVLYNASLYKDEFGEVVGVFAAARDISDLKKAENSLKSINRELMAIRSCNQAMIRASDEQTLLNNVCNIICEEAGYILAWVGYVKYDNTKSIRPMAWAGFESDYIKEAKLSWGEDTKRGLGPAGIAIRSGETVHVQDFKKDSRMDPWRESALMRGYRSGIALPLKDENEQVFGVLLIYSAKPYSITSNEIKLMKQLADDLSFGILSLRTRIKRKTVEKELKLASLYNRSLIEASLDPLVTIGSDGKVTDVNKATEKVTGYSRNKLIGTDFSSYFTEPEKAREGYEHVFDQGFVRDYSLEIEHCDGGVTPVLYNASLYKDEFGEVVGVFAAARDISDLKKAEERLKKSEERMRLTLEATQIGLWDWDVKNDEWYASPIYYSMLGYTPRSGLADREKWLRRVHPDDRVMVKNKIDKVLNQDFDSYSYEARMLHADGTYHWVSVSGFGMERDQNGKVTRILGIRMDITERKNAEEQIRMLANVVESSDDAIITKSLDGKIISWNKGAESIYGYSSNEVMGCDISIIAPYELKNEIKNLIKDVQNGKKVVHYETERLRKDGKLIYVSLTLSPIFDNAGNLLGISTIARDITERKKSQDLILKSKEEWENTFDAVPDLVAILDTNFQIVRVNKAMADRLGVTTEDAVGLTCYEVVHDTDDPPDFCPFKKLLKDNQEHTAEVHEDRLGGDFVVSVSPLYDSEGKLMGSVHVARDITDRIKAETEVIKSLKEKEALLSEIHDRVKNNMQIISSIINLQTQYSSNNETLEVLQDAQDRVKAMANIYEKLYQSNDLTRINFTEYIQSMVKGLFYSHEISEGDIKSLVQIENVMLNIETAVPCGLIINELVSNSLKHAFPDKRNGEIKIILHSIDEHFELIISDNGIGLPEDLDFKETDTLGLQLVNSLIKQIDGEISLNLSHGTEFRIIFNELEYQKRV